MNSPNLTESRNERDRQLHFEILFEQSPQALSVLQANLTFCWANQAAKELFAARIEGLDGHSVLEFVAAADSEEFLSLIAQTVREEKASPRKHFRFVNNNGVQVATEVQARNVFAPDQQILLICRDVSEQTITLNRAAELAFVDALTGLPNLRRFEEVVHRELKLSRRTERPFSILLLDLDHLKKINDTGGHLAGNRALCRLAEVLRGQCRATHTAGRFGGDEFFLVLPETNATEAIFCADRIRRALEQEIELPRLSASIGVASSPSDGTTPESLIAAADARLYRAKSNR
jgi:diguanylate cyclase (GGDEF)-like protein/PAS domain S-box-containing protein